MNRCSGRPYYDLTYNVGVGGEHLRTISGEDRHSGLERMLKLATAVDLPEPWTRQTIERITTVAANFPLLRRGAALRQSRETFSKMRSKRTERERLNTALSIEEKPVAATIITYNQETCYSLIVAFAIQYG